MLTRLLLSCAVILATASAARASDPVYEFALKKGDDSIIAAKDGDKVVFTITGKSGTGNGTITLKEGQWPKEVVLRFQHGKGQPFKGLEDFHLTTARFKVDGSQKTSKAMPFSLAGDDGKFAGGPAGTLNVAVEVTKDGLDVKLPANLLTGAGSVKIEWVDFFRN
jgi:hypothetical protein